jgi:hypothetical protein
MSTPAHPLAEGRVTIYGEPPTMPDISPGARGAPRVRPAWWPAWWYYLPELAERYGDDDPPLTREQIDIGDYR